MAHARDFGLESGNQEAAQKLVFDFRDCGFGEADSALCEYALKLTLTPQKMAQADVDQLRAVSLSDEQITVAAQVIGYFNYINRIADGLGVDLEDSMTQSESDWKSSKPDWRAGMA